MSLFEDAAYYLAMALANHSNSNDPGSLIVLVPNPRYRAFLEKRVLDAMNSLCMPGVLDRTQIMFDLSDDDWRWKGTAALALEKIYLDDHPCSLVSADR